MSRKLILIVFMVSLGGFLFGFDAGIISQVIPDAWSEFDLNDVQASWVVSSPSFAAMISMLLAFSLGSVMWVLLSELYPIKYGGFNIVVIGFVNGMVQQVFPWELLRE